RQQGCRHPRCSSACDLRSCPSRDQGCHLRCCSSRLSHFCHLPRRCSSCRRLPRCSSCDDRCSRSSCCYRCSRSSFRLRLWSWTPWLRSRPLWLWTRPCQLRPQLRLWPWHFRRLHHPSPQEEVCRHLPRCSSCDHCCSRSSCCYRCSRSSFRLWPRSWTPWLRSGPLRLRTRSCQLRSQLRLRPWHFRRLHHPSPQEEV
ncbi:hypothetical protein HPB47_019966, partial [Ixodes persulcatus]